MGAGSGSSRRSAGRTSSQPAGGAGTRQASSLATAPLPEFANQVQALANVAPDDGMFAMMFGSGPSGKAFIADVWDAVKDTPAGRGLTLESFKQRLGEANQARLIDLSRLDLVQAVIPEGPGWQSVPTGPGTGKRSVEDVRRAEVSVDGATFHLIRRRPL